MCSSGTISHNKCSYVKKINRWNWELPGVTVFYNTLSQKAPHLRLSHSTNRRAGCKRSVANSEKITFKKELKKKKEGNVGKKETDRHCDDPICQVTQLRWAKGLPLPMRRAACQTRKGESLPTAYVYLSTLRRLPRKWSSPSGQLFLLSYNVGSDCWEHVVLFAWNGTKSRLSLLFSYRHTMWPLVSCLSSWPYWYRMQLRVHSGKYNYTYKFIVK